MPNYVLLDSEKHQNIKLLPQGNFIHTAKFHQVSLTLGEFAHASTSFPVVFMKDPQQGKFRAAAMLGLLADKNLYCSEDDWLGVYVPAVILRAPFELGPDLNDDKTLTLYIDEDSEYISESNGQALFEAQQPSQRLLQVQKMFADYFQDEIATQKFTEQLLKHSLLREIELNVKFDDQKVTKIRGIYSINEDALRLLPASDLSDFHLNGYLMPIYAMLASLGQINRLIKLHNASLQPKISAVQMRIDSGEE
jgi:hypothetical protein